MFLSNRRPRMRLILATSLAMGIPIPHTLPAAGSDGVWQHRAFFYPPVSIQFSASAFDSRTKRFYLITDDFATWVLDLSGFPRWSRLATQDAPQARSFYTLIHDPTEDRLIVFGGTLGGSWTNEVWALSLGSGPAWTKLTPPEESPAPRARNAFAYDSARNELLIYGGRGPVPPYYYNDLWALELEPQSGRWRQIAAQDGSTPLAGESAVAVYDSINDRLLLAEPQKTWELPLFAASPWHELAPGILTDEFRTAAYDQPNDRFVIFGVDHGQGNLWALQLHQSNSWTNLTSEAGYRMSATHTGAFDPDGNRMIIFGGGYSASPWSPGSYSNDAWALDLAGSPRWVSLTRNIQARYNHQMVLDPIRQEIVVAGGRRTSSLYENTVWRLSLNDPVAWVGTDASDLMPEGGSAIFDARRDNFILIGGQRMYYPGCHPLGDAWAPRYQARIITMPGGTAAGSEAPAPVYEGFSSIHDTARDRIVIFGGNQTTYTGCDHVAQFSYTLHNAMKAMPLLTPGNWETLASPEGGPGERTEHSAVYDELRDRMIVFGGRNSSGQLGELWVCSFSDGNTWRSIAPEGDTPSPRAGHTAVYDSSRDRMVLYGGHAREDRCPERTPTEAWALSLSDYHWTRLETGGEGPEMEDHTAIYDPVRDQMVLFGGVSSCDQQPGNDLWILNWGDPAVVMSLDVVPGDPGNGIDVSGAEVVSVAIFGGEDVPAADILPESVRLNGSAPLASTRLDVNGDQRPDLLINARIDQLGLVQNGSLVRLEARSRSGRRLTGHDRVSIISQGPVPRLGLTILSGNPVRGEDLVLSVNLPYSGSATLEIIDPSGRRVGVEKVSIGGSGAGTLTVRSLKSMAAGVYFLRLRQGDASAVARCLLLH